MAQSQPIYAPCDGGLVLNSNNFELLNTPGIATRLRNFEVALSGGYRRINGFSKFGSSSATQPNSTNPMLGVHPYALGVVVCSGTNIYYTEDGITWLQVNKDTGDPGVTEANLSSQTTLTRTSQGKAKFVIAKGTTGYTTNPYGILYIATGPNKIAHFRIDGTGPSRTFVYKELSTPTNGKWIENHSKHLCVVDFENSPNTVYYSATNSFDDFAGTGAGSITLSQQIKGIKSFREDLYIFCENSIHRLTNINDSSTIQIVPVTGNLGCIDGFTIQEIGGDLIFLAPDGLRTIAGTERLSDVELGSLSRPIQTLLDAVIADNSDYTFESIVIREKNQYRLFYIDSSGFGNGFIGTLRTRPDGVTSFQWSEIKDLPVYSINSYFNDAGEEVIYHGGFNGYLYLHDTGNDFDGSAIQSEYRSPYIHLTDLGSRKTLNYLNLSISNEGSVAMTITPKFDFNSSTVHQPSPYTLALTGGSSVYGTARYGTAEYGALLDQIKRIPLYGSGHTVSFRFISGDTNAPYTIHGFHLEFIPSGRK